MSNVKLIKTGGILDQMVAGTAKKEDLALPYDRSTQIRSRPIGAKNMSSTFQPYKLTTAVSPAPKLTPFQKLLQNAWTEETGLRETAGQVQKYATNLAQNNPDDGGPDDPNLLGRLGLTAKGAGQSYAGSSINALSTLADYGIFNNAWTEEQGLMDTAQQVQKSAVERKLAKTTDPTKSARLKTVLDGITNKPGAEEILNAADPIRDAGHSLLTKAGESTAKAKQGASWLGRLGIDAATGAMQLAGDIGIGALTGGSAMVPMALRSFGGAAQEAEDAGASINQQVGYGTMTAATSILVERISSAGKIMSKAFGKGIADDVLEKGLRKFAGKIIKNQAVAGWLAAAVAGGAGEGLEEMIESSLSPLFQKLTYDPNAKFDADTVSDMLYDGLVGAIIGGVAGGVGGSNVQTTAQDVAKTPSTIAPALQDIAPQPAQAPTSAQNSLEVKLPTEAQNAAGGIVEPTAAIEPMAKPREQTGPHIDDRSYSDVSSRKVKAFQFDNPELHEHFAQAAGGMQQQLNSVIKGERIFTWHPDAIAGESTAAETLRVTANKRSASPEIVGLLDNAKLSYAQIEKGLEDLIADRGQENYAAAKKIELVLDDMLTNGFEVDGYQVEPDYEYIRKKEAIKSGEQTNDYSMTEDEWNALLNSEPSPSASSIFPENSLGAKLTQKLPQGTGAASNSFVPEQKTSKVFTNTYQKTDSLTDAQRAQMKPEDYQYDVRGHAQNETAAQQRVEVDYEGEIADLNAKRGWTDEDVFTSKKILDKISADAEKSGDFAELNKWTKAIQERGTRGGQTIEAFKAFQKTPEGAVIKAQQVIAEAEKKLTTKKEAGKDVKNATGRKIHAEKEQTVKAITDEANEVAKSTNASDVAVEWWVRDTSIKLSEKIAKNAENKGANKKAETTMQTMLKDLVRITSGAAPQGDTVKAKSTAATDSLRNYWANPEQYEAAVQRAQRYINERYASDPESLAVFNDWLSGSGINTWQLIGKALQENGVKFNEILMSSWQDKAQLLNKVTERILADTDLTQEESAKAAQYISDKFYDELAQRAEKKVAQLLKPTSHKQQKTMAQRVSEFINSGAFSDESIAELVKAKYGIPTLTSADVQKIYELNNLAQETDNDYQKRVYLNRSARIIADKLPVTGKQRVIAVRRMAMLLNPKTLISRNAGGNVVFGILDDIKDAPGTLVDLGVSKITGKRTTSYNPFATSKAEFLGLKKGLSEWGKDVKNKVDTSPTEHEMPRTPSFKGAVGRGFEEALNKLLQLGDRPFYEAAKEKRLDELKRLGLDYTSEDAIAEANVYALERVFQNNSTLAKKAVQLRDSLGVLGDIAIPFAQTPANIFDKLADYSPYGFVRAIKKAGAIKDSAWSQKQFVDTLSRSLTGTGLLTFAYFAAQAGLISGGEDREEDEGLSYQKKISGWQPYSIVVGDKTYTYDWMTVGGAMLSLGADIAQSENAGDTMLAILSAGAKAGINTMFNQSYLEGISELFGGEDIASGLESVFLGLPASFTPTAFQQIARIIDPIARDTYDTDPFKRAWNKVKAKLPYASKTLPAKIGASGEELTNFQGSKATNIFESVLSPGYIGENQKTAIDTEAHRLYRATGDSGVLPKWSKYTSKGDMAITIDGEKLSMSTAEWGQYQKTRGKQTYKMLDELIKSPDYKAMTDAQKADAMQGIIGYASDIAKGEYAKAKGKEYESSAYAKVREVEAAGISPVKYFEYQNALKKERPEGGTPSQLQFSKAINTLNISNKQKGKLWDIQNGEPSDKNPFTGELATMGMNPKNIIGATERYDALLEDITDETAAAAGANKSEIRSSYIRQWLKNKGYTAEDIDVVIASLGFAKKISSESEAYVAANPR